MAGATNRAFKAAGIPKAAIKELRVSGSRGMTLRSAISLAGERGIAIPDKAKAHLAARDRKAASSPEGQAAASDFRAKAAAGLKSVAERKAALQAALQQRVGRSIGDAMKIARGMRQKQAADAAQKAAAERQAPPLTPRQKAAENAYATSEREYKRARAALASNEPIKAFTHASNAVDFAVKARKLGIDERRARISGVGSSTIYKVALDARNDHYIALRKEGEKQRNALIARTAQNLSGVSKIARGMRQKQAADAQAKAAADAPVRIKPQPASPSDARAAHARRNAIRKTEHHSLRTSMRGYGRMSEGQLQPIRADLSAGRAAVAAAGAPPKGQTWRYGAGTVSAVKPSKQGNGFFAYQEGRGGRTYIVHAASGVSVGDYRDKMIAHAALDGMKKGGDRLSAGLSRGDEKAVKLAFRYQQKTRTSGYAVQTQRKVFAKQNADRKARGLPSL